VTAIILLPAVLAVILLLRLRPSTVLLNFYLPVLLLFPLYFVWHQPGLPPIDAAQGVMLAFLPILFLYPERYFVTISDLLITAFILMAALSVQLSPTDTGASFYVQDVRISKNAIFVLVGLFLSIGMPYLMGKLMIEQEEVRWKVMRRICVLLAIVAFLSVYEYRMGSNPYRRYLGWMFPGQGEEWHEQIRWGYARISGPYAHAILAGMMFLTGLMFHRCLAVLKKWPETYKSFSMRYLSPAREVFILLVAGIWMAGSRGPWLGAIFSYPLIPISASKRLWRNLVLYALAVAFVYGVVFNVLDAYTAGGRKAATNEQQEAAAYRRELIANYTPYVEKAPVMGWGTIDFPKVKGMESIDNEYLLLAVTQGFVGLGLFSLLCIRAVWRLTWLGLKTKDMEERVCSFTLLAILIGVMVSISTVFLGTQVQQIFFLVLGWTEALGRQDRREVLRLARVIA
jgi:hypothetical protein